jgi:YHS domain-containing protein
MQPTWYVIHNREYHSVWSVNVDAVAENVRTYTVCVEGSVLPLKDRDFITTILARSTEGEMENALVLATPEQVEKLHNFLRVQEVTPTVDGIYIGNSGLWYSVKHGAVAESGRWKVPPEVLTSQAFESDSPVNVATRVDLGERDPVCGITLRPGQEASSITYHEQTYHFCSAECRGIFLDNPSQYVDQGIGRSN